MNVLLDVVNVQIKQIRGYTRETGKRVLGYRELIEKGKLITDPPRPIPFDPGIVSDLYDIRLINKLFTLGSLIRRANNDIENFGRLYSKLADRFIENQIDEDTYTRNATYLVEAAEGLANALEVYTDEVKELAAEAVIALRQPQPVAHRILSGVTKSLFVNLHVPTDDEKRHVRESLEEDIRQVGAESRARVQATESGRPVAKPSPTDPAS